MLRFLFLILTTGFVLPVQADLGAANRTTKPSALEQTQFEAWCVEKNTACEVKFENGRLIVDNSSGINASQLIKWSKTDKFESEGGFLNFSGPHHLYLYDFKYRNNRGEIMEARIIFQNSKYSDKFTKKLKQWSYLKEYDCRYNFADRKVNC